MQARTNSILKAKMVIFLVGATLAASISEVFAFTQFTEAEHVAGNGIVKNDESASNGMIVRGGTFYRLVLFEVSQQVTDPVYLWIRYNTGEGGSVTLRDQNKSVILQESITPTGTGWDWLRLGPFNATDAQSYFYVSPIIRINGVVDKTYRYFKLDAFILSVNGSLDPQDYFDSVHQEKADQGTHSSLASPHVNNEMVVDGSLGEQAWTDGLWVGPFLDDESTDFASEKTFFSICYDEERLYVGIRAYESSLAEGVPPEEAITARITSNDGPVWKDDSIELLVRSSTDSNIAYRIVANIIGSVYDEKQNGDGVNIGYSTGAIALGSTHSEGYYELEMAVPLSGLDLNPQQDPYVKFNIARHRPRTGEHSSWGGFDPLTHQPLRFGTVVFTDRVPAVTIQARDRFLQAENDFVVQAAQTHLFSDLHLEFYRLESENLEISQESILPLPQLSSPITFTVDTSILEGPFPYGLRLRDAATSTLFYQSPIYEAQLILDILHYALEANGPVTLSVNGNVIDQGASLEGNFGLLAGANQVTIASQGEVSGIFSNALQEINAQEDGWLVESSEGGTFTSRMTMVAGMSRFNPRYRDYYTLAEDLDMPMYLLVQGLKDHVLTEYRFFAQVPSSFEIKHATGYYGGTAGHAVSLQEIGGSPPGTRLYQIAFQEPVPFVEELESFQVIQLMVNAGSARGNYNREYAFDYWAEAESGQVRELVQRMPIRIVPFLRNQPLRRIFAPLWSSQESSLNNDAHKHSLLNCYAQTGFNDVLITDRESEDELGLTSTLHLHLAADSVNVTDFMAEHSGNADPLLNFAATDGEGNYSTLKLCPEIIRTHTEARELIKTRLMGLLQAKGLPERATWDYEIGPYHWEPVRSYNCFGPRCLNRFRSKYGISSSVPLNRESLKQNYASRWPAFRAMQASETAAVFQEAILAVNQTHGVDIAFSVHSGYGTDPSQYGWDWTYAPGLGLRYAQCGYGRHFDKLQDTLEVIGPNVDLVGGVLIGNYGLDNPEPARAVSHLEVVQRVIDCGHVFLYVAKNLTGQTLSEVSKAFAMIGEYEDVIVDGTKHFDRIHAPGFEGTNEAVLYEHEQEFLVLIVNSSDKELTLPVTLDGIPQGLRGVEYYTGTKVHTPQAFTAFLKPKSVFALGIRDEAGAASESAVISFNDLSWAEGQLSHRITRFTTTSGSGDPPDGHSGPLVNYFTGETINEVLTVTGGSWNGLTHATTGSLSEPQTDATAAFNGFVNAQGVVSCSTPLVLTFSNLDPHSLYNVVVFGNADSLYYSDRITGFTLQGVASFDNLSTLGASYDGHGDTTVSFTTARNTVKGYVARFQKIDAGEDGTFSVTAFNQTTDEQAKSYINVVRLERVSGALKADEDVDGLPDIWETYHFGSEYGLFADGLDDYDQDGVSNRDEYIAGTNPTSKDDHLWLSVTSTNQQLQLAHPTLKAEGWVYRGASRFYTLEQCNPSIQPWDWSPVPGHVDVLGADQEIRCTMDVEPGSYMYRSKVRLE